MFVLKMQIIAITLQPINFTIFILSYVFWEVHYSPTCSRTRNWISCLTTNSVFCFLFLFLSITTHDCRSAIDPREREKTERENKQLQELLGKLQADKEALTNTEKSSRPVSKKKKKRVSTVSMSLCGHEPL